MTRFKLFLSGCFLILVSWKSAGPNYPVSVACELQEPPSVYLRDYGIPGSRQMAIRLILNDLREPYRDVYVKLRISGPGIDIRSKAFFKPQPVRLNAGVTRRLYGNHLAPYLSAQNLVFQGYNSRRYSKSGRIPSGHYEICVQVMDWEKEIPLSGWGCRSTVLALHDPPIIVMPANGAKVRLTVPQNLIVQWQPVHTLVPGHNFDPEYVVTLTEIRPADRPPEEAIQVLAPVLKKTTRRTMMILGPEVLPLVPGMRYALRVQVRNAAGRSLFKDQGYSQTIGFVYGQKCEIPELVKTRGDTVSAAKIKWYAERNHDSFRVKYRPVNTGSGKWYFRTSVREETFLDKLRDQIKYEYKVSGKCGEQYSPYSVPDTFVVHSGEEETYACGAFDEPEEITDRKLVENLFEGDVIRASGFRIQLKEVQKTGNGFSGNGTTHLPFFNESILNVHFKHLKVNKAGEVFAGELNVEGIGTGLFTESGEGFISKLPALQSRLNQLSTISAGLMEFSGKLSDISKQVHDGVAFLDSGNVKSITGDIVDKSEKLLQRGLDKMEDGDSTEGKALLDKSADLLNTSVEVLKGQGSIGSSVITGLLEEGIQMIRNNFLMAADTLEKKKTNAGKKLKAYKEAQLKQLKEMQFGEGEAVSTWKRMTVHEPGKGERLSGEEITQIRQSANKSGLVITEKMYRYQWLRGRYMDVAGKLDVLTKESSWQKLLENMELELWELLQDPAALIGKNWSDLDYNQKARIRTFLINRLKKALADT